jgi:hypothetical protein
VRPAGRLPRPVSDLAAVTLGDAIELAGGHDAAGTSATLAELRSG